jgi:hypothetical protein
MSFAINMMIIAGVALVGFIVAKTFVRRRLRFVDAVYGPLAPLTVGVLAAGLAWPFALLPIITGTTAVIFGIGAGMGTASGVRALKRGTA